MIFKFSLFFVSDYRLIQSLLLPVQKSYCSSSFKCRSLFLGNYYKSILRNRPAIAQSSNYKMSSETISSNVFQGKEDRYRGITVFSDKETCENNELADKLKRSFDIWKTTGKRAIWFRVHLNQCEWVPILVKNGFKYHHAKADYVMLYFWLSTEESDNVPSYAHTMIGVGAVVTNDQNQVLVVQEKFFYKAPMWKLPGGHVDPGENLVDAAIREVAEETGIKAEFISILTIRHAHGGMFHCSDMYVVIHFKALNHEIKKCDREITACQWMDIDEYLNHPKVHELNRFFVEKMLEHRKHNIKISYHEAVHQLLNKPYIVYSVAKDSKDVSVNERESDVLY